ncbi:helix-turn-helix domain-containing protein [Bacillus velezensis]|uniref:helix-turn-helix transcriptional regulator n=1 Tax=Bacillus velezensis TaxID=492670 RepID=UPI00111C973C|nr:helix-turn-helix transcriptional regulator [Bacillus velezensis]TNU34017.1 helix-turn-helix transcriptional regulator [Bacillus velezensis]UWD96815.1 helix-turn-helix domain-containing protein [Bacillus velezensis]
MYLNLFIARKENRKSQNDIAQYLNITKQTYCRKEKGMADFTITEGRKLADYFGRSLDELFQKS